MSRNVQVARTVTVLTALSLVAKAAAFLRESVVAALFGASAYADAFLIANAVPVVVSGAIATGITAATLPRIAGLLSLGRDEEATALQNQAMSLTLTTSVVLAVLGYLFADRIGSSLAPGFTGEQLTLTVHLLRTLSVGIALQALSLVMSGILNARKSFVVPAVAPLVSSVVLVFVTMALSNRLGIMAMVVGTLMAQGLNILIQVPYMKGRFPRLRELFGGMQTFTLAIPASLQHLFQHLTILTDRWFASGLPVGSAAALDFAFKTLQVPVGILGLSYVTAVFPMMSEQATRRDWAGFSLTLQRGLRWLTLVAGPCTVGAWLLREPIVRFLFQRGAFDSTATLMTSEALASYGIGTVAFLVVLLLNRAFYAIQNTWVPMAGSVISIIIHFILSFILVEFLGHSGLAVALALANIFVVFILLVFLRVKCPWVTFSGFNRFLVKIGVALSAMSAAVYLTHYGIGTRAGTAGALWECVVPGATGLVAFMVSSHLAGIEEVTQLVHKINRWVPLK